ncbi:MAG: hypothetical protein GX842_03355 [Spirochaetales bacterium]|jgi:quercetin dioxygenase-like cupin family protein|nr:hypothetical protein [Spirochaetales bacterium]
MPEKVYSFSTDDVTAVERIVNNEDVRINHLSLVGGESVDPHATAEAAHFIVTKGVLSLRLNEGIEEQYPEGSIIAIKAGSMLAISNRHTMTMHLFVIKTDIS